MHRWRSSDHKQDRRLPPPLEPRMPPTTLQVTPPRRHKSKLLSSTSSNESSASKTKRGGRRWSFRLFRGSVVLCAWRLSSVKKKRELCSFVSDNPIFCSDCCCFLKTTRFPLDDWPPQPMPLEDFSSRYHFVQKWL